MYPYIWLGLMILFLVVEASCPLHLVSVWFAVGSLAAMIAALLGGAVWLQIALFVVVSGVLLALLLPIVRKYIRPRIVKTNLDAIIGSQGYVTADIYNVEAKGQVKLGAMEWTARSTTGDPIPQGALVCVDRIEGAKVFVTPVEQEAKV